MKSEKKRHHIKPLLFTVLGIGKESESRQEVTTEQNDCMCQRVNDLCFCRWVLA